MASLDEATLQRLEEEIEREEKAIETLQHRTRTLEVEVAAWPPPSNLRSLYVAATRQAKLEGFLGAILGSAVFGLGWALLAIIKRWRS